MFDKAQEEQMALAEKKRVVEEDKAKILEVPICLFTCPIDCHIMCPSWLGAVEEATAKMLEVPICLFTCPIDCHMMCPSWLGAVEEATAKILEVLAGCRPLSAPWWLGVE